MVDFAPPPLPTLSAKFCLWFTTNAEEITGVISVEIDVTGQLRTVYSAFVKYFRRNSI